MSDVGKLLIIFGIGLAIVGAMVWALGRAGFHGLPGDIKYQGDHVRFYFPIVSCIVLSIVLTGIMWLWRWLSGR
jgi:hypothetical protein